MPADSSVDYTHKDSKKKCIVCIYICISVCFLVRKVVLACFRLPLIVSVWYDRFSLQFVRVLSTFIYVISCDWISKKNGCRGRIYFCCGVSLLFLYRTSTVDLYLILLDYGGCSDGSHRTHIPIPRNPTHKTQGKLTINSLHNDKCLPSLVHSSVLTSTEMNLRGRLPRHKIKS